MAKFVVLNTICSDGVGDFSHFEDIMKALLANHKFKNVEFTAIVYFENRRNIRSERGSDEAFARYAALNEATYLRVAEKLKTLGITYFYGRDGLFYESQRTAVIVPPVSGEMASQLPAGHRKAAAGEPVLDDESGYHAAKATCQHIHQAILEADQGICISHAAGICLEYLWELVGRGIPVKYIGEHEVTADIKNINRGLGLSKKSYGIKIQDIPSIEPYKAWSIILENDHDLATQLLTKTNSDSFEIFNHRHIVVPAYFNDICSFILFLKFFSLQGSFTQDRDVVVYLSGDIGVSFKKNEDIEFHFTELKNTNIERLELFHPQGDALSVGINHHTTNSFNIKIFYGFHVTNLSYDAIFQLSKIAGVSGDNTFERCISMNILPFYRSTNHNRKEPTLEALKEITQLKCLSMPLEARESYKIFFDPQIMNRFFWTTFVKREEAPSPEAEKYRHIDLQKMIEYWPVVTEYLRRNKNFYNNLDDIILEKLPSKVLKQLTTPTPTSTSQTEWSINPFRFLYKKTITATSQQQEPTEGKKPDKREFPVRPV